MDADVQLLSPSQHQSAINLFCRNPLFLLLLLQHSSHIFHPSYLVIPFPWGRSLLLLLQNCHCCWLSVNCLSLCVCVCLSRSSNRFIYSVIRCRCFPALGPRVVAAAAAVVINARAAAPSSYRGAATTAAAATLQQRQQQHDNNNNNSNSSSSNSHHHQIKPPSSFPWHSN